MRGSRRWDDRRAVGYGDPGEARACLEDLVNHRLLTALGGGENPGYELIHDLLAAVVEKSRTAREELRSLGMQRMSLLEIHLDSLKINLENLHQGHRRHAIRGTYFHSQSGECTSEIRLPEKRTMLTRLRLTKALLSGR